MAKKKARKAPVATAPEPAPVTVEPTPEPVAQATPDPVPAIKVKKASPGMFIYFAGLALAVLAAILIPSGLSYYTYAVLAVLGFVVGLMNITEQEVLMFLVATLAFIVSANSVKGVLGASPVVAQLLSNVIIFTAAAAFIVSMKAIIKVSRTE
jgi:hypothetical protein